MSMLIEYNLREEGHHDALKSAMKTMAEALGKSDNRGFDYSSYLTDDSSQFVALLEFEDESAKAAFMESEAFAAYRQAVQPLLASPPKTQNIFAVASTRS